jgi:hypothetical protein
MDNCTLSNRAMYLEGRHDAFSQITLLFLGVLSLLAMFAACIAIAAPKKNIAPAPPAYSTDASYEDPATTVLIEPDLSDKE